MLFSSAKLVGAIVSKQSHSSYIKYCPIKSHTMAYYVSFYICATFYFHPKHRISSPYFQTWVIEPVSVSASSWRGSLIHDTCHSSPGQASLSSSSGPATIKGQSWHHLDICFTSLTKRGKPTPCYCSHIVYSEQVCECILHILKAFCVFMNRKWHYNI